MKFSCNKSLDGIGGIRGYTPVVMNQLCDEIVPLKIFTCFQYQGCSYAPTARRQSDNMFRSAVGGQKQY